MPAVAHWTGFVGRRDALETLAAECAIAAGGAARIVWVVGESGVGKTSLVRAFLDDAPSHRLVWASGDEAETALPFGVVDQIGETPASGDELAVGARLLRELGSFDGLTVLVIDDLQWSDPSSAMALRFAMRRLQVEPILVVLVTRSDPLDGLGDAWVRLLEDSHRVRRLDVGGLDVRELMELADRMSLSALDLPAADRLHAHTRGHPLHARVLLEELGSGGIRDAGEVLPAPRSLATVTMARVAVLSREAQDLMAAGAVLGSTFELPLAAAMVASDDPLPALEEGLDAGLVERTPAGPVSFAHPLFRGAVYNDLAPTRRRDLHISAASLTAGSAQLQHRVAATAGPDDALAAELELAADTEIERGAPLIAAGLLQAAARLSLDPEDRDRRVLRAVEAFFLANQPGRAGSLRQEVEGCAESPRRSCILGLYESASNHFTGAIAHFDAAVVEPGEVRALAQSGLAIAQLFLGHVEEALEAANGALAGGTSWGEGAIRYVQALALTLLDRTEEARRLAAALDLEGAADEVRNVDVLAARGMLRFLDDDHENAVADLTAVVRRGRADGRMIIAVMSDLGELHYRLGNWDDALLYGELAVSLAYDTGRMHWLLQAHAQVVFVLAGRGQFADAQAHLESALALARTTGVWTGSLHAAMGRAAIAEAKGDAPGMADAVADLPAGHTSTWFEALGLWRWRAVEIEASLAKGHHDAAAEGLTALERLIVDHNRRSARADVARLAGQLAEARGDEAGAIARYRDGVADVTDGALPLPLARLNLAFGTLLRRSGERKLAIDRLRTAPRDPRPARSRPVPRAMRRRADGLRAAGTRHHQRPARPHISGADGRPPGREWPGEPRGGITPLREHEGHRVPPRSHLRQARHSLPTPARRADEPPCLTELWRSRDSTRGAP